MNNRLINTKVAAAAGCTDIVDNYDPFGSGLALYQLNGNANDVSTNYNGTWSGTESYSAGVFGQAANFTGTNYIETSLRVGQDWSVSFWINSSAFSDQQRAIQTFNSIEDIGFQFRGETDGTMLFWAVNGGSSNVADGTIVRSANTWYHIVGAYSYTNSKITLYVNGQQDVSATANLDVSSSTYPIRIGQQVGGSDSQDYKLDQVRVFNTALDPLEVEALYKEELCICDGTVDTLDILGDGSCIATYQLDGNANDLSGNYSGTPTDVSYGVGEFDLAGVFNGSTSNINIDATATTPIDFSSENFTISMWLNPSSLSSLNAILGKYSASADSPTTKRSIIIRHTASGEIQVTENDGSSVFVQLSTGTISANTWSFVSYVRDGSSSHIYINDNSAETQSRTNTIKDGSTQPITIGGVRPDNADFNGSIDQVRIFNKALNSSEVTTLYNETACTKAACTGTTNTLDILGDGSCIATYPLDGSPADLSGNYNGVQTDVTYPVGEFDLSAQFYGSSSVTLNNFPTSVLNTGSISFWFKVPASSDSAVQAFFGNESTTSADTLNVYFRQSDNLFAVGNNGTQELITGGFIYDDDLWHHFVITPSSVYIDNNLALSYTNGQNCPSTGTLHLGKRYLNQMRYKNYLDQVRIFNKALSAGEVTTLYNETPCN